MARLMKLAGLLLAATCTLAVAGNADYERGARDGYANRDYPEKYRGNKDYADGYKAGENRRKGGDSGRGRDYDDGYRDGLHNAPQRHKDRSRAYAEGYSAGKADRAGGSSRPSSLRGDYKKLAGKPAKDLAPWMSRYGYTKGSESKTDLEVMTQWCRGQERPCLQSTVRDSVIMSVAEIK